MTELYINKDKNSRLVETVYFEDAFNILINGKEVTKIEFNLDYNEEFLIDMRKEDENAPFSFARFGKSKFIYF